ncbi:MAG: DUF488 domain-containing protein [Thermomicrobiales bacterium]|nr:DUF488 domain-containing protein [Thermomicrobiales bacterium]
MSMIPQAGDQLSPTEKPRDTSPACDDWANATVYTIGHSTRPQADLIALLKHYGVATLADVRTVPRSRHNPQFNRDELTVTLPEAGIAYAHLPLLGGLRRGLGADSPNTGWRNTSFRAYADYMQSADFAEGLCQLNALTADGPVALMCAEAVPWRCHRSLIADALTIRGVPVREIQSLTRTEVHKLTPFAQVDGLHLIYPGPEESAPAPTSPTA